MKNPALAVVIIVTFALAVLFLVWDADTGGVSAGVPQTPTKQPDPGDTDGDGCSDAQENGSDEFAGGKRDYQNPYDYFNPSGDGFNRLDDLLGVIEHYSPAGSPPYDVQYDRGPNIGPESWSASAPDGVIDLFNDIVTILLQYRHDCSTPPPAGPTPSPATGLSFSLGVDTDANAGDDCDTSGGSTKCFLDLDATFTLNYYLDSLPNGVNDYVGIQTRITYSGVTSKDNGDLSIWPDCDNNTNLAYYAPGGAELVCWTGLIPTLLDSTYTGLIATLDLNCTASGTISLVHGQLDTALFEDASTFNIEMNGPTKDLTLNCGATATPTKQPDPGDTDGDGCSDAQENGSDEFTGGKRDYQNPYDYFNPSGDGFNRLDDLLGVIEHYSPAGSPPYDVQYDRGPNIGPESWSASAPDGKIDLFNDIVNILLQYRHDCSTPPPAGPTPSPATGLSFSLGANTDGMAGDECDTSGGPTKCAMNVGDTFTLNYYLDSLPNGVADYVGIQTRITYSGVTSKDNGSMTWPDCGGSADFTYYAPGEAEIVCMSGLIPPLPDSTYTGLVATLDLNCTASGTISMVHGQLDTALFEDASTFNIETNGSTKDLTINCGKLPDPGDTDGDGCSDVRENGLDEFLGGQRDFLDPYDYFNPSGDSFNRMDDILGVIEHYSPAGSPPYDVQYDIGAQVGANHWDRAGPDGVINLFNDIVGSILQYHHDCSTPPQLPTPTPSAGLNFSIGIDATGDGTDDCDTKGGAFKCSIPADDTFTLNYYLDSISGGISGYVALQTSVDYSGVTSKDNGDLASWVDCGTSFEVYLPDEADLFCTTGLIPALLDSTYTGLIGTLEFTCNSHGAISLVHGEIDTALFEDAATSHVEAGPSESLAINCIIPAESAASTIGAGGGSIDTGTGDTVEIELTIPAGSLSGDEDITIDVYDATTVPAPTGGGDFFSRAFVFEPDGLTFDPPATAVISYDESEVSGIDESTIDVIVYDSLADDWVIATVLSRDTVANTITIEMPHFSTRLICRGDDCDLDGCTNTAEEGPDEGVGGLRDMLNPWDFYDVAIAGAIKGQDQQIDLFNDIVSVIDHYAPTGLEPEYDAWYDRGPSAGPNPWNMTAPDGKIDLFNDIVGVINQFGHDCR